MKLLSIIYSNKFIKNLCEYLLCLLLCFLCLSFILDLKQFNFNIPYIYSGDGLSTGLTIKGMIENGWYNINPFLGAPFGLEMYDYPLGGDNLQYLIMKVLSLLNMNFVGVMNLYYLLTFPFCMITSFMVFRHFKIHFFISLSFSALFTFIPYHIIRAGHLFLLGYYMIPLVIMVMIWVVDKEGFLFDSVLTKGKKTVVIKWDKYLYASIIICICIGSTGAYYAFFSCFFFLIVGIYKWLEERKPIKIIKSLILITMVALTLLINISPSIYYKLTNNNENSVTNRDFESAEIFGLKITQLLLPTTNHNVEWLKEKKDLYNSKAPLVNENDTASLGVIGSLGFLLLLINLIYKKERKSKINETLSVLNICAVLLGTIGGFGVLFAALISSQIRSYNRISIFIAFFAFLFLALNLETVMKKIKASIRIYCIFAISLIITIFGIYDQTTHPLKPTNEIAELYNNDEEFIHKISQTVPPKSMIFQVPYVSFPEGQSLNSMGNYDLLKGYLHSKELYWSFGNMKNSFGDKWMRELVKKPLNESLSIISHVGYAGIYVDRSGYSSDYLNRLEEELSNILNVEPIISKNQQLAYYNLDKFTKKQKSKYTVTNWNEIKESYLRKINYGKEVSIVGKESWSFVENRKGYKIVQTDNYSDLPLSQLDINIINPKNVNLSFDDSFKTSNKFSFRHWESPKHLVLSLDNADTGWNDEYVPTNSDINNYFSENNYLLKYTPVANTGEISFNE